MTKARPRAEFVAPRKALVGPAPTSVRRQGPLWIRKPLATVRRRGGSHQDHFCPVILGSPAAGWASSLFFFATIEGMPRYPTASWPAA